MFFWSADDRILVVDLEPTLKAAKNSAAVAKALTAAADKGWKIAYLAVNADRPLAYRKLRTTVRQHDAEVAPEAPVLGRKTYYQGVSDADARMAVLADLKHVGRGPLMYVTVEQGIKLWTVGSDGVPTGAVLLADWPALSAALPP